MANELQLPTKYYDIQEAQRRDFREYMASQAEMGANISSGLEQVQSSVNAQTVAMVASQAVLAQTFNQGFSGISNQLGSMGVSFSMGLDRVSNSLNRLSQDICNRLDAIHDIVNNPLLTQSRELYRRAVVNYNKGFFEEALEDIKNSLEKSKTDYISWFLEGKIYSFGASKFSNVIDLDLAIAAFANAAKYNDPDITESNDARLMAAEIYFYWGIAQYAKSNDLLHENKKTEASEMLMKARKAFEQSYQYSNNMLESLFNIARCKAIQSDVDGAIKDLENLVQKDRNYCIRFYADGDFSVIETQFTALINKLKNAAFIPAKNDYDRISNLLSELTSIGGSTTVKLPSNFTEELPYFDVLDYGAKFKEFTPIVKNAIARNSIAKFQNCISVTFDSTFGLRTDGTVVAVGNNKYGQCNTEGWRDIVAIAAGKTYAKTHTVGLKADGTVVAVGDNDYGQCNTKGWRDIMAITAGVLYTVGLKSDGTVVAVGDNKDGQCNTEDWRDIVVISTGGWHTVGLKSDGTVVAVGNNKYGQCNTEGWCDIVAIATRGHHTVGLKSDGTVVAVGSNEYGQCNTESWWDIVAIAAGNIYTFGLKSDGTVVAVGSNEYGKCNTESWRDIVAISTDSHAVGLKADGTVMAVGYNEYGQCNTHSWNNIGTVNKEQLLEKKRKKEEQRRLEEQQLLEKKRKEEEQRRLKEQQRIEQSNKWVSQGLCKHCGGEFGGLFTKKCKSCGTVKDY